MLKIFDSHAHYDNEQFDEDREELLLQLPQQGITRVMNIACDLESTVESPKLAEKYDYIYSTVGVHPHDASTVDQKALDLIAKQALLPKVQAIGEIGLDFYYDYSPREEQQEAFIAQLRLAHDLDMPVVIHSRDAHQLTLDILKKYRPQGIVHCFSGSAELAIEMQKLGLYLGFTGVVTFKNARKAVEAAAATDISRILVETDCPYMAPVPYRGTRCNSTMLTQVVKVLSEIKGVTPEEIAAKTMENANRIYRI